MSASLLGRVVLLGLLVAAAPLSAQEIIQKVRYQGGHAAWGEDEIRGSLAIGDSALVFVDKDGRRELVIPLLRVTELGTQVQRKEASVGSKLLFGGLARSRQEEFITVSFESEEDAEAVVFRFEPKTSASALAKIRFRMKKLGAPPAAKTETEPVIVPAP